MTRAAKWLAAFFPVAFSLLIRTGAKTAHTPAWRFTGIAGWALVAAGFLSVAVTIWYSARPRRRRMLDWTPVQAPVKLDHSAQYAPPPHRWHYTSAQRRK